MLLRFSYNNFLGHDRLNTAEQCNPYKVMGSQKLTILHEKGNVYASFRYTNVLNRIGVRLQPSDVFLLVVGNHCIICYNSNRIV